MITRHGVIPALLTILVICLMATQAHSASLLVTSPADDGVGTLRAAILTANGNAEPDTITFSPGTMNIQLGNSLPNITQGDLTIDGTGSTVSILGSSTATPTHRAFVLVGVSNCIIRQVRVTTAIYGVQISGGTNNLVESCTLQSNTFPCTLWNATTLNTVRSCNIENNTNGIQLGSTSPAQTIANSNTIGGNTASLGNRISGHSTQAAIILQGLVGVTPCNNNIIIGNRIGVNAAGTAAQANSRGIELLRGANNRIGGTTVGERNIISGNATGIWLRNSQTQNNLIQGNYIGIAEDGVTAIPNVLHGIRIETSARINTIGGATAAHGNLISRNLNGISIDAATTIRNSILRNSIYGNTNAGILLTNGANNSVLVPTIDSLIPSITGTAIGSGTVQLFVDAGGQGEILLDVATLSASAYSSSASLAAHEGKNLTAVFTDSDGDSSMFSTAKLIDITPPSGSISTADPIINDNNVVIDVAPPTDNLTPTANIEMRFSNDDATWSAFEPYAATKNWDLYFGVLPVGGLHTVYAQFRDASGNVSASATTTVEIDITPPTGGFNAGLIVATDPNITLNIDPPSDNNTASNDVEMRFSNDDATWTPFEPYAATRAWDLNFGLLDTSDGIRTIYMQLRDDAGNVSSSFTVLLELDTTGPLVTGFLMLDASPTTASTVNFSLTFNEPVLFFETGANPANDDLFLEQTGGVSGAAITNIVENGGNNYTVTVSTGTGSGFISLDVVDTGDLTDDNGNDFTAVTSAGPYVLDYLSITDQPEGGIPTEQQPFSFTVAAANGIGALHYEWRKDGTPISGAPDDATFAIPLLQMTDSGDYTVVVSDDYVSVESDVATLTVQSLIPVATGVGLTLLSGIMAAAAATMLRRRK